MTAIIILNYNSYSDTINCIRSIERFNSAPVKYFIVDNGSPDPNAIKRIEDYLISTGKNYRIVDDATTTSDESPYFTLIRCETNDGYARGNNKGLRLAFDDNPIDHILILNNDTLFVEDILPGLINKIESFEDCAFITPLILTKEGEIDHTCARLAFSEWDIIIPFLLFKRDFFHWLTKIQQKNKVLIQNPELLTKDSFPVHMPSGACMLIRKDVFKRLGGFDPNTFLYYEEPILAKKIEDLGMRNYCVPSLRCVHLGGNSTNKSNSTFIQRCNMESADYFLNHFMNPSWIQRVIWGYCKFAWKLKWLVYR